VSDYEHLIYERRGPVTIITINRPERMNAIGILPDHEAPPAPIIDVDFPQFRRDPNYCEVVICRCLTEPAEERQCALQRSRQDRVARVVATHATAATIVATRQTATYASKQR
jgi:hypothetical protein